MKEEGQGWGLLSKKARLKALSGVYDDDLLKRLKEVSGPPEWYEELKKKGVLELKATDFFLRSRHALERYLLFQCYEFASNSEDLNLILFLFFHTRDLLYEYANNGKQRGRQEPRFWYKLTVSCLSLVSKYINDFFDDFYENFILTPYGLTNHWLDINLEFEILETTKWKVLNSVTILDYIEAFKHHGKDVAICKDCKDEFWKQCLQMILKMVEDPLFTPILEGNTPEDLMLGLFCFVRDKMSLSKLPWKKKVHSLATKMKGVLKSGPIGKKTKDGEKDPIIMDRN